MTEDNTNITLAVYMERLDGYIEGQTKLNDALYVKMEKLDADVEEIKLWRTRFYGAKSALLVMGAVCVHTAVVLGSLIGIMNWFSKS
jgi:hypothetical protein